MGIPRRPCNSEDKEEEIMTSLTTIVRGSVPKFIPHLLQLRFCDDLRMLPRLWSLYLFLMPCHYQKMDLSIYQKVSPFPTHDSESLTGTTFCGPQQDQKNYIDGKWRKPRREIPFLLPSETSDECRDKRHKRLKRLPDTYCPGLLLK